MKKAWYVVAALATARAYLVTPVRTILASSDFKILVSWICIFALAYLRHVRAIGLLYALGASAFEIMTYAILWTGFDTEFLSPVGTVIPAVNAISWNARDTTATRRSISLRACSSHRRRQKKRQNEDQCRCKPSEIFLHEDLLPTSNCQAGMRENM